MRSARNLARFGWMDRVGARWWPIFGAAYFMVAVKRSAGPKLVGAAWKKSPIPANAPVSIAGSASATSAAGQNDAKADFAAVRGVLEQRCYTCHGAQVQMKNLRLDEPALVRQNAQAIYQQVVVQKLMPMNNATQITDAERALIGRWFEAGALVP